MSDESVEALIFLISLDPLIDKEHLYNILYMLDFYHRKQFGKPLFGFTYEERNYGMYPVELKSVVLELQKEHVFDANDGFFLPLRSSHLDPTKRLFVWAVWTEMKDMGKKRLVKKVRSAVSELIRK